MPFKTKRASVLNCPIHRTFRPELFCAFMKIIKKNERLVEAD